MCRTQLSFFLSLSVGKREIQQHHDSGLCIEPRQRNHADPYGNAEIIIKEKQQPDCADKREGKSQQHDTGFGDGPGIQIQQKEDNAERDWDNDLEPLFCPLEIGKLPGPLEPISSWKVDPLCDNLSGVSYIISNPPVCHIHKDEADELPVFAPHHRWTSRQLYLGHLAHRNLRAPRGWHEHPLERFEVLTKLACIAHVNGIPFPPFNDFGNVRAADSRHYHIFNILHRQIMPGRLLTLHMKVNEIAARDPLSKSATSIRLCPGIFLQGTLNPNRDLLNCCKVWPKHLNPQRAPNACREHLGARLHGHPPDVGHARIAHRLVHLSDKPFPSEPGSPL